MQVPSRTVDSSKGIQPSLVSDVLTLVPTDRYDRLTSSRVKDMTGNCPRSGCYALISGHSESTIAVCFNFLFVVDVRVPGNRVLPLLFAHVWQLDEHPRFDGVTAGEAPWRPIKKYHFPPTKDIEGITIATCCLPVCLHVCRLSLSLSYTRPLARSPGHSLARHPLVCPLTCLPAHCPLARCLQVWRVCASLYLSLLYSPPRYTFSARAGRGIYK